jgi:hypothetical protein
MGGAGGSRLGDTCMAIHAMLSADDYFEGLEAVETSDGRKYRRGSRLVTEFPERLNVTAIIRVIKCGTGVREDAAQARTLLESLRLEAKWKTGMKTRSVRRLDAHFRQPSYEEWRQRPTIKKLEKSGIEPEDPVLSGIWYYELAIDDEHVSLMDSLIVTIFFNDGMQIARLSARL